MVLTGLAFLVTWLEVQVFGLEVVKALLVTAIIFIVLGLVVGERPWVGWNKP